MSEARPEKVKISPRIPLERAANTNPSITGIETAIDGFSAVSNFKSNSGQTVRCADTGSNGYATLLLDQKATVNAGAFLAPIICGLLGKAYGYHFGFGFAGFGMLVGLVWYARGARHLPPDPPRVHTASTKTRLTPADRRVVFVLLALVPLFATFWVAQSQVWNVYNVWVRDYVDLQVGGWTMPVPWMQAIDGLLPLGCMPLVVLFWRRQATSSTAAPRFAAGSSASSRCGEIQP